MKFLDSAPTRIFPDPVLRKRATFVQDKCVSYLGKTDADEVSEFIQSSIGISTAREYVSYGLKENQIGDNWRTVLLSCTRSIHKTNLPSAELFFHLGRIHESLNKERAERRAVLETSSILNSDSEIENFKRTCARYDHGSRFTSSVLKKSFGRYMSENANQLNLIGSGGPAKKPRESSEDLDKLHASQKLFQCMKLFEDHSGFVAAAKQAGINGLNLRDELFYAATARIRSMDTILSYCKCIEGLYTHLRSKTSDESNFSGPQSKFYISTFLRESPGCTVPHFRKTALVFWKNLLEIDWDLEHPIVRHSAKITRSSEIKQAPAFEAFQIRAMEAIAVDKSRDYGMRVCCSAILLMTHASLRWNDTLHIRDLKLKDGVISGILTSSKTSSSPEPFTCPERGFRTLKWSHPIFQFREDFFKDHGEYPIYLFPLINKFWFITSNQPASKKMVLERLREIIHDIGVPSGLTADNYTLHSPRNFYTNSANQVGWSLESQTVLGRWSKNSKMPDRYIRSNGSLELQLRTDIANRIRNGWEPVGKFQIPNPPPSSFPHFGRQDTATVSVDELD